MLDRNGVRDFFISCNFARSTITAPDFVEKCQGIIARHRFIRELLIFEVTESEKSRDQVQMAEHIKACLLYTSWVIGYILGVEWEDVTVAYTNEKYPERASYSGTYMYTTADATPFEAMLCQVGDKIIEYETERYKQQRLVAFSNWPTTDPFLYPAAITNFFMKCAQVDVEHIKTTDAFLSGPFASYHVYPYYPDYMNYVLNPVEIQDTDPLWDDEKNNMKIYQSNGVTYKTALSGNEQED